MTPRTRRPLSDWIAGGIFAAILLVAVFSHVEFAIGRDSVDGKSWPLHMMNAFKIDHCAFAWTHILEWYRTTPHTLAHYPPVPYLAVSAVHRLFGSAMHTAFYLSQIAWLVACALALFAAGRRLGRSAWAGLAAAVLGCLNPIVLGQARTVETDYAVMVVVALGIYAYLRTDGWRRVADSVALGAVCGLAMLVKPSAFFFLAPFLAAAFVFPEGRAPARLKVRAVRLAWCLGAAAVLTATYYAPLLDVIAGEATGEAVNAKSALLDNIGVYVRLTNGAFFPTVVLLLAVASLAVQAVRRERLAVAWICALVVPMFFMLGLQGPSEHYLYPYQVVVALIVARGAAYVRPFVRGAAAVSLAVIYVWPLAFQNPLVHCESSRFWTSNIPPAVRWPYVNSYRLHKSFESLEITRTEPFFVGVYWPEIRDLSEVLGGRFGAFENPEIGVLPDTYAFDTTQLALARIRTEKAWTYSYVSTAPFDTSEDDYHQRMLSRPLVVWVRMGDWVEQRRPIDSAQVALRAELERTHARAFAIRYGLRRRDPMEMAVYVRSDQLERIADDRAGAASVEPARDLP